MVRFIAFLVGAAFSLVLLIALWGSVSGIISDPAERTVETSQYRVHAEPQNLPSDGWFGRYDNRQLQRGFQVFQEVCSACHSLRLVAFRDLQRIGYDEGQVKAIARGWRIQQPSVNAETGEAAGRPNVPSDHFPLPFANDVAARAANNNAVPPDLSDMTKARHGGADYIHALLTGYRNPPASLHRDFPDFTVPPGLHYNPVFATMNIAMPPPLTSEGQVQYMDGTRPTVDQMARDVSAFLVWTAEPNLTARHTAGWPALIFILIFCGLAWGAYKNVWRDKAH